ncbi:MAG TPA: hypothetical protein VE244_12270 [Nitrososphaeraceae archaeon]|jgi:hypothetical protein|nr:hypothetical protein [Nitrososphaeraceae archaeon]
MKGVWTVSIIVYLIIATVFILNNQFSQEAFAIPNALPSDLSSNDHGCDDCGDNGPPNALSSNDHGDGAESSDLSSSVRGPPGPPGSYQTNMGNHPE